MLKTLLTALLMVVLFSTPTYAQENPSAEAILGHRNVNEWLSWYLNGELLLDHTELVRRPETRIAIRSCTQLSLEEAIRRSRGAPLRVADFLQHFHGYTPERISILFSETCLVDKDKPIEVEVWVVPQGAAMPSAEASYRVYEVREYLRKRERVSRQRNTVPLRGSNPR